MSLKNIVVLCMTIVYCECINKHALFHSEPTLAGRMCSQDKVEFQEVRRSVTECVKLCAVDPRCHSLIFYHGNKTCFGLKVADLFLEAESFSMPGTVFYRPNTTTTSPTEAAPEPGCNETIPMIAPLPDSQFSASSELGSGYVASSARLNDTKCWTSYFINPQEYIQVEFVELQVVTSVITRGDPGYNEWVTTYKVLISDDCTTFTAISNGSGAEKIFNGNVDNASDAENIIEPPVKTRCLRIQAVTWQKTISIRFEAMGCLA